MDLTNIPTLVAVPFASGAGAGYRNAIPVASQIPVTPGAASFTDGFPPVTFQPIASGGVPPYGADVNGILYALSNMARWNQAGGRYYYNATFSTAVTGYPKGATLNRTDNLGAWLNTVDNNTTDPNSASSSGWLPMRANAVAVSIAVTAGINTPTKEKLGSQVIVCTGAIASAATLLLPLTAGSVYVVHNNTTGAGTLEVHGATGSGVTIPQTVGYYVYTDGTNFYGASADVSGLYLPVNGTAVAATKLASARTFSITGGVTATGVSFDGTGNLTLNVTAIPGNAATATKWASAITLTLAGIATGTASIDGSGNATLTTAVADNALTISKTSGLQTALAAKADLSGAAFTGNVSTTGVVTGVGGVQTGQTFSATSANCILAPTGAGTIYLRPNGSPSGTGQVVIASSGAMTVTGTIVASNLSGTNTGDQTSVSGNAGSATKLQTARTISGISFDGSTAITIPYSGLSGLPTLGTMASQNASAVAITGGTAAFTGNVSTTGSVTATGGFQNSDRRLKKNITTRDVQRGFALKLARMFVEWDRIADGVHDVGLIAQRVKAIASRYVIRGEKQGRKAGTLAIDKAGIALEASMDCALQIDEQAKTIRALLRRIEKLEKAQ